MKKTTILSAVLAGSLMALGGLGCSKNEPDTQTPANVNSQAQQQKENLPAQVSPNPYGPNPSATPEERQPVKGIDEPNTIQPSPQAPPMNPNDPTQPGGMSPEKPNPNKLPNQPNPGPGGSSGSGSGSGSSGSGSGN